MFLKDYITLLTLFVFAEACNFPANWHDSWMINGYMSTRRMDISRDRIPTKGRCLEAVQDRYLLLEKSTGPDGEESNCYRCMVFTVRHVNVIQFKERIQCNPTNTVNLLDRLCSEVGADTTLHTIVREHAVPISCPEILQKSLSFTYDNGHGMCEEDIQSSINQCASDKRLQLDFGACPDNAYPEKKIEVQCLANWKISGGNWLYVKSGENDYRCMYYESQSKMLGISADASCIGLSLIYTAATFIQWQEVPSVPQVTASCDYPSWFNPREWSDLQADYIYRYDLSTSELVVDRQIRGVVSYTDTSQRHVCHQKVSETVQEVKYITEVTDGCSHGYQCVIFRKKSDTVLELVTGEMTSNPINACSSRRLLRSRSTTRILIDSNADPVNCPLSGEYTLQPYTNHCSITMEMGCTSPSSIVIKKCDMIEANLLCLARWTDNGVNHLVISTDQYPRGGNCYTYRVENKDVIIELDESCNYQAPVVLDSSYPHPPFRLPPPTRKCADTEGFSKDNYQASNQESKSLSIHSASQSVMSALTLVLFSQILCVLLL